MLSVEFRGVLEQPAVPFGVPIADLSCFEVGGTVLLTAASEAGGGLTSYALAATASAQFQAAVTYTGGGQGLSGVDLLTLQSGGGTYAVPVGPSMSDWFAYQVDAATGPASGASLLPSNSPPVPVMTAVSGDFGGDTYLFALPSIGEDIQVFRMDAGMTPGQVGSLQTAGAGLSALAVVGGDVLLATDLTGHGVISYRIASDGTLTEADRKGSADGIGMHTPTAIETLTVGGQEFAIVAAAGSSSLTVLHVAPDGSLTATDHVLDTMGTRFRGVSELAVARHGDWQLLLAAGNDDGVSVFALLPDGRLLHLDSIEDTLVSTLDNVSALEAAVLGSELQIFAASQTEAGISQFRADLSGLGVIRQGGDTPGLVTGSNLDDVLIAGNGGDELFGDVGADVFVFRAGREAPDGNLGTVKDYDPAEDRLDLSSLPFLYGVNQVTVESTSTGAILRFRDFWLTVESASGTSLSAADFSDASVLNAQHAQIIGTDGSWKPPARGPDDPGDYQRGTDAAEQMEGTGGRDSLLGMGGDDQIIGGGGNDTLEGGDGADTLNGGDENDLLSGGAGDDWLQGGNGADTLIGGGGEDTLDGGAGQDRAIFMSSAAQASVFRQAADLYLVATPDEMTWISGVETLEFADQTLSTSAYDGVAIAQIQTGGAGADFLQGGSGADVLVGSLGDDRLLGWGGNDTLVGDAGNDTLNGGDGNDLIIGGKTEADGRDIVYAGAGHDSVDAGYGNDLVYGQDGNDTIAGGFGADELQGQGGDDVLNGAAYSDLIFGGDGNDFINGGFGHDRVNGGAGADKFYHLGIFNHGSDWVQDYDAAEGDVLLFGQGGADASDFQVNFAHTANADGERSGDDAIAEAFIIYKPTTQIIWALVDGAGQTEINLQIGGEVFDLLV